MYVIWNDRTLGWMSQCFVYGEDNNPNFFFLTYDKSTLEVRNFLTIPKYFFVPAIIEKRKALSPTARRAGWVGCNIDVSNIPEIGKIFFVQNGVRKSKDEVLEKWSKTDFVKAAGNVESNGWLLDVLMCVEKINKGHDISCPYKMSMGLKGCCKPSIRLITM